MWCTFWVVRVHKRIPVSRCLGPISLASKILRNVVYSLERISVGTANRDTDHVLTPLHLPGIRGNPVDSIHFTSCSSSS